MPIPHDATINLFGLRHASIGDHHIELRWRHPDVGGGSTRLTRARQARWQDIRFISDTVLRRLGSVRRGRAFSASGVLPARRAR